MLHTQLQHLPRDTFKFYLKRRDKFFRDATTQASPSMLKHLSSYIIKGSKLSFLQPLVVQPASFCLGIIVTGLFLSSEFFDVMVCNNCFEPF